MQPPALLPLAAGLTALAFALCCGPCCGAGGPSKPRSAERPSPASSAPSADPTTAPVAAPAAPAPAPQARIASGRLSLPLGEVRVGDAFDRLPAELERTTRSQETCTEEGCETVQTIELRSGGELWATAFQRYDLSREAYVAEIGELSITSPRARTAEGIGPGVPILEVYRACPDVRIWYTYISDRFVVECPRHDKVQFELPPSAFKGDRSKLGMSEIDDISRADLDLDAAIASVRLF